MKKISLLISLVLCVTIGSVYATWVYTQTDDVADINHSTPVNLTEATFEGTYGTYSVDASGLTLTVDPKAGTTHVTSLKITGDLKIHFTPSQYAPVEVKENGVDSTFQFGLSNDNWVYNSQPIMTVVNANKNAITWGNPDSNGVFTYTISAADLANYLQLTEFTLDTKIDYDNYDTELAKGQVKIHISDGKTTNAA